MSQITTHVLDTAKGHPAAGIPISLFHLDKGNWIEISQGVTNQDGRIADLLADGITLAAGRYRMRFMLEGYFSSQDQPSFYPQVDIECNLSGAGDHYHIPLLISPFGYTTYRGS